METIKMIGNESLFEQFHEALVEDLIIEENVVKTFTASFNLTLKEARAAMRKKHIVIGSKIYHSPKKQLGNICCFGQYRLTLIELNSKELKEFYSE